MQVFFSNFLKIFQAAPEYPKPPQNLSYRGSAAAVTATGIPTPTVAPAAAMIAATAAAGTGPTGRTTTAEENDEDQDDPQTAITAPATIVTPHKSEPPNQS
jgi:hypothetical protein